MVVRVNMWALLDLPYVAHPLIIKKISNIQKVYSDTHIYKNCSCYASLLPDN
jgi:hypothetical protein